MRKFFLFMLAVMILSTMNFTYGQQCQSGPLRPNATVPYTYAVNISSLNGYSDAGNFSWYVTNNPNILAGTEVPSTGGVITVGAGLTYGKTSLAPGQKNLILTWSVDAIALAATNPYYLVVKYGQNNGVCDASNIKVWKITPINSFLLTIDAVDNTGANSTGIACAADITGIVIDPATDKATYTYGENIFYARITPSNINGEWTPKVKIPTLNTGQTIKELGWSTSISGIYTAFTGAANSTGGEFTSPDNATASPDGSHPIFVKLAISNGSWEGTTEQVINLGVDGTYSNANLKDTKSSSDCSEEADFGKAVALTIKARPEIVTNTPSGDPLAIPTAPNTNFLIP